MITTEPTGVIKVDFAALKEKLATPEGEKEVQTVLSGIKAFNNDQYSSVLNNFKETLKPTLKDELYAEHKRDIHGSLEKEIMNKYGLQELKPGTDFKTTSELIGLVEAKIKKESSATPDAKDKEIEKRDKRLQELTAQLEGMVDKKELEKTNNEFADSYLDLTIRTLGSRVEGDDEKKVADKLEFLKFKFISAGYKISKKDNNFVVVDKEGKIAEDNTTFKPVPVLKFIEGFAANVIELKESPATGRGADSNPANSGDAELLELKTKQNFMDFLKKKNIQIGTSEGNQLYEKWMKIHNIKN